MGGVAPDYAASVDFLQRWSSGSWVLTSIEPDGKGVATRSFTPSDRGAVVPWLESNGAIRNVYFTVNPLLRDVASKPAREDVAALAWLHVDIDPRAGEDLAAEQARALQLLREPPGGIPPATVVTFSGGGYQGFWRLAEPFQIDGVEEKYEEAKLWNLQLEITFGGDHCHNVDRIMRLPGTINRPNAKKRKKGRTEALAHLVDWHEDRVYDLAKFAKAPLLQGTDSFAARKVKVNGNVVRFAKVDDIPGRLTDSAKIIIVQGHDPDEHKKFGDSRSEWLFFACCEMVRAGCSDDDIYAVITDPDFLISASVLDKGSLTEKYALRQIERAREYAVEPWLMKLNDKHAVVGSISGKCRIISEEVDPAFGGRARVTYQSFADFRNRYLNKRVDLAGPNGQPTWVPAGNWWVAHPHRREYENIVFAPGREVPGSYNLWKGFAYEAKPGDCSLFLEHVLNNVCSGIQEHYDYLMGWLASSVQRPDSQGHTAVVLRGRQGVGKGTLAKHVGKLFGRHFMHVSDAKHLVGNFNAHLKDCVLLFADEAFYAGDRRHESVLKMLVTEDTITVEKKGVDVESAPNYVHLVMASNHDWVVPAGLDERRFFVLDVGEGSMQNRAYFSNIEEQLKVGGYCALLHMLMTYDLANFDVRAIPRTRALQEQKIFSFTSEEEWWFGKLKEGEVLEGLGWPKEIIGQQLVQEYTEYCRTWNVPGRGNNTRLGRFLRKCFPDQHEFKVQLSGMHTIKNDRGETIVMDRPRAYILPPLEVCRKHWDEHFGGPYEWTALREVHHEHNGHPF